MTKPVFTGEGNRVSSQWQDDEGRPICYLLYDEELGDEAGSFAQSDTGAIQSTASVSQWFDDHIDMFTPM